MFRLTISIPYEGDYSQYFDSIEDAIAYIKATKPISRSFDDYELVEIAREISIYPLMAEG